MPGKLIVIDGIDGSGKKTQTKLLVEHLKKNGARVETLDFPQYDSFFGKMVRAYLDGAYGDPTKINPRLASLLYAADRWDHADTIRQWLNDGATVVLDRYYTSNLIHQAPKLSDDQLDEFVEWLDQLEFEIFKIPKPNIVLFLDVDAQTAYSLITKRGAGHDGHEQLEHLKQSHRKSLALSKRFGWIVISCCDNGILLNIDTIAQKIRQTVNPFLAVDN